MENIDGSAGWPVSGGFNLHGKRERHRQPSRRPTGGAGVSPPPFEGSFRMLVQVTRHPQPEGTGGRPAGRASAVVVARLGGGDTLAKALHLRQFQLHHAGVALSAPGNELRTDQ